MCNDEEDLVRLHTSYHYAARVGLPCAAQHSDKTTYAATQAAARCDIQRVPI
jgi:hypothetical protein